MEIILDGKKNNLGCELQEHPHRRAVNLRRPKVRGEIKEFKNIVIHENAGTSNPFKLSNSFKKYGYHLSVDRDGYIVQYTDLRHKIAHAGQMNGRSIGIVVMNPYYPALAETLDVKGHTTPAAWWTHCVPKHDRRYFVPTEKQLDRLNLLCLRLCHLLHIPFDFPTQNLNRKKRKITGWKLRRKPAPGIVAHSDFSKHADGRFPLEDMIDMNASLVNNGF